MKKTYYDTEKYNRCLEDIGKLIYKTSRIFQEIERDQVNISGHSITQSVLLNEIMQSPEGSCTMQHLLAVMKLEKSTLTRIIDTLVKHGLVERIKSDTDRRAVSVGLTEKGAAQSRLIQNERMDYYRNIISALPPGHVREVMSSFEILIDALEGGMKNSGKNMEDK